MITGGSSGIGHAIAERFLSEGVGRVILVGRSYKRLLDAAKRLDSSSGSSADNEVATRAPEEDNQDLGQVGTETETETRENGVVAHSSQRISLLVGDVARAGEWMRELEREMVSSIPPGIPRYI